MFSLVYASLLTAISEYLTDHKEIIHPYDLEIFNKQDNLTKGFGLAVGPATINNSNGFLLSVQRTFTLTLTRKFYTANYTPSFRQEKEKELIDTAFSLYNNLRNRFQLCPRINSISLESDTGIEFFEDNKYINYSINILVDYKGE